MDIRSTETESVSLPRIGCNMVSLLRLADEETWPPWLRAALSIGFVAFAGASMLVCLYIAEVE